MAFFSKKPKNGYNSYDDDSYDNSFDRGDYEDGEGDVIDGFDDAEPTRPTTPPPAAPVAAPHAPEAPRDAGVALLKPRGYQDGPDIVRYLKSGCGTVLNIEDVDATEAQRLIVFLLGALEAMDGELKRVNKTTFALSPRKGVLRDGE